jgi:hypothetical protein
MSIDSVTAIPELNGITAAKRPGNITAARLCLFSVSYGLHLLRHSISGSPLSSGSKSQEKHQKGA